MEMKVALYLRTSKTDQNPENQKLELENYCNAQGWEYQTFEEQESTKKTRPIKKDVFNRACWKEFDMIMVWKLDRWARSLQELVYDLGILRQHKAGFISLKDNIVLDDDPRNMLMIHMLGAFAEFERSMIRERTLLGLARARAEGKTLGRPRKKSLPKKEEKQ